MDVELETEVAHEVDLPRLDGVAEAVDEALGAVRHIALLAPRPVPLDRSVAQGSAALRRDGDGPAMLEIEVDELLLDGRGDLAARRIEHLVAAVEDLFLDAEDRGVEVQHVAVAVLAHEARVTIHRDATPAGLAHVAGPDADRLHERQV